MRRSASRPHSSCNSTEPATGTGGSRQSINSMISVFWRCVPHGRDVSQAVFRLEHVDRHLLADCERDYTACNGSLFMMHRWIGPDEQRLDPDGPVVFRRPRYVVTHYPRFRKPALSEVQRVDPRAEVMNADSARTIVSGATPGCGVAEAFQAQHPTFVQHLAPVRARVRLDGHAGDLARISSAVDRIQPLDRSLTFAVQCRKTDCTIAGPHGEAPYGARDVEVRVGSHLEGTGLTVDRDCPDQVLSVLLSGPHAFVGASKVEENLAVHADEHRRRSTRSRVVSRARHKLEEAIDTFRIPVGPSTRVLDLGAAPGGWTAFLMEAGATVIAVDPGALSPAVAAHPRVSHLRCRIEEASLICRPFGLIVNDMSLRSNRVGGADVPGRVQPGIGRPRGDDHQAAIAARPRAPPRCHQGSATRLSRRGRATPLPQSTGSHSTPGPAGHDLRWLATASR